MSRTTAADRTLALFHECGALLEGHFLLSSGLHSNRYLQCALILQHPERSAELGRAIGDLCRGVKVDAVVGPALGGIVIAHEVARALRARCLFTERVDGKMALRRGFTLGAPERALIVEDVVTTGGSTREVIDVVTARGGTVVGVASIVNRSGSNPFAPLAYHALLEIEVPSWEPSACPLCRSGSAGPAVKPGSRT